jgi:hypothetical protein
MGASTVADLIAKGKSQNAYNNSGIKTDSVWIGHFNDALRDLADDLNTEDSTSLVYDGTISTMDLPDDYYELVDLNTDSGSPIYKRRSMPSRSSGYWILYRGNKWVLDIQGYSAQSFELIYNRYSAELTAVGDYPEIPPTGEMALVYYAIEKGLRNNNQVGQANEMQVQYERERKKIRTAIARGRG